MVNALTHPLGGVGGSCLPCAWGTKDMINSDESLDWAAVRLAVLSVACAPSLRLFLPRRSLAESGCGLVGKLGVITVIKRKKERNNERIRIR